MADNPFVSGGSGSSSGGSSSNPFVGGGSSKKSGRAPQISTKTIRKALRDAIASGDVEKTRRITKKAGFSARDRKALLAVAGWQEPKSGFLGRAIDDISQTVTGTAKGLPALGVAAAKEAVATPRLAVDVIQGDDVGWRQALTAAPVVGSIYAGGQAAVTGKQLEGGYAPLSGGAGESLHRTGSRVANPRQAVRDYSARPFSTLVEDAGNVAVVTAAAGSAARAAGLTRTASAVERVNAAANQLNDLPFKPVSVPARALNKGYQAATASERAAPLMDALRVSPQFRQARRTMMGTGLEEATMRNRVAKDFAAQQKLLPSRPEQEAMYMTGEGVVPALVKARETLPADQFPTAVRQAVGTKYSLEGAIAATDAAMGKNPDLAKRIDEGLALGREGRQAREAGYQSRGPTTRVEQSGMEPLSDVIAEKTAPTVKKLERAQLKALEARGKANNEQALVDAHARELASRQGLRREDALERNAVIDEQRNVARRTAAETRSVKERLRNAEKELVEATKEYRARDEQFRLARKSDPNWGGLAALRDDTLAAYRRYSDAVTEVSALRRDVETAPQMELPTRVKVPARVEPRDILRKMPAAGRVEYLQGQARRAERLVSGREAQLAKVTENVAQSIEAAPARLRPLLEANRAVVRTFTDHENTLRAAGLNLDAARVGVLADEIPTTLKMLRDADIDVEHFINPRAKPPTDLGIGPSGTKRLPRTGRLNESRRRTGRGQHDMTIKAQAKAEMQRASQLIQRQALAQWEQMPFVKRGSDMMVTDEGAFTPRYPTRAELQEQGLEAWAPGNPFEVAAQVGPDTLIVPLKIHEAYKTYWKSGHIEKMLEKTYDPVTRGFKYMVLPLSPSWNLGNLITNAFMATLGGGVNPLTLANQMRIAIAEHARTGEWPGGERLYGAGSTHETLDFMGNLPPAGKFRKTVTAPGRAGYKVNETVDNMFRSAVYLAKRKKGYSHEAAVQLGLRTMGDFTNLTAFERRTVRRVVPFYSWLRHMTQVAFRLPIEHPYRTAWILSMSNQFKDQEAWETMLPRFMQGQLPIGDGQTVGVGNFMPFSNPLAITQFAGNLNPIIKFGLTNTPGSPARGQNLLTGNAYTRPPGSGRTDEFGRMLPTAPSLLQQLRVIPPQLRMVDALSGRNDIARYESGDPVMIRGDDGKLHPIPVERSGSAAVFKYFGVPIRSQKDLEQIVSSIIARQARNWQDANPKKKTGEPTAPSSSSGNPFVR